MDQYFVVEMSPGRGWVIVAVKNSQDEAIQAAQRLVESRKDRNYKLFVAKTISMIGMEVALKPFVNTY